MIHLAKCSIFSNLPYLKYSEDSNKRLPTCCKQAHEQQTFPCMYSYNVAAGMHQVHYKVCIF